MDMDSSLIFTIFLIFIGMAQATPTPSPTPTPTVKPMLPYRSLAAYRYSPQFCGDTLTGRELYVGEVFTRPGQCVRVQCLGTLQLWEDSCKVPHALKGTCAVLPPTELNLDYPRCCPLYECKTYESNSQGELEQTNTYDHTGNLRKSHVTELIVIGKDRQMGGGPANIPTAPVRNYNL